MGLTRDDDGDYGDEGGATIAYIGGVSDEEQSPYNNESDE